MMTLVDLIALLRRILRDEGDMQTCVKHVHVAHVPKGETVEKVMTVQCSPDVYRE